MKNPFRYFNKSPEVIRLAVMMYLRFPLSLRQVEDLLYERGIANRQRCGRWLNNRAENSHQPFRRREGAMTRFRDIRTLRIFASAHASIYNLFNLERHLNRRSDFKQNRSAALAE